MILVFVLFLAGVIAFCVQTSWRIREIMAGKPDHRNNAYWQRFKYALATTFGQTRIAERPWGWVHIVLMWAFFVFLTSAGEMLIACLKPGFTWAELFGSDVHGVLCVIQTYFAWASIAAVIFATCRRLISKKTFSNFDAYFILADILLLMLTHLACVSALIAEQHIASGAASLLPAERLFASFFDASEAASIHTIASTIHLVLMSVFLCWIPNSKHLHIVLAWPDAWFAHREWFGRRPSFSPPRIDFEAYETACAEISDDQELPSLGLAHYSDTTRKQRLEALCCTLCKRCTNVCPMVQSGLTTQGPMESLLSLKALVLRKNKSDNPALLNHLIGDTELWSCTQCGACDRACPLTHEHVLRTLLMRRDAATQDNVPQKIQKFFANIERSGNPWGYPRKDRRNLLKLSDKEVSSDSLKLYLKLVMERSKQRVAKASSSSVRRAFEPKRRIIPQKIAVFAGCMASYDKKAATTLNAVILWLQRSGFEVTLIAGESCCGEPLRRAGNEFGFEAQALSNIEKINASGAELVITACPHCAFTLSDSYRAFGTKVRALHIIQFWHELFDANHLSVKHTKLGSIALHVPCYLSKYADETRFVEQLLKSCGYNVKQTGDARQTSCCGAGGARFFFSEDRLIPGNRTRELMQLNADQLSTLCPFCNQMLDDTLHRVSETPSKCINLLDQLTEMVSFRR